MNSALRRFARRLFAYPPFAHHPTCRCYDDHLLRLGPLAVCLGCTCFGVGVIVGLLACPMMGQMGPMWLMLVGVGMYLPTLGQPFVQVKAFKAASRLLLGVAIPLLLFAGLVLPPLDTVGFGLRVGFVVVFVAVFRLSLWLCAWFTPRPCDTCPHGRYPLCEGNAVRVGRLLEELRASSPEAAQRAAALVAAKDVAGLKEAAQ